MLALGDCLEALCVASDQLKRDPTDAIAIRDYNFGVSRIFQIIGNSRVNGWTTPKVSLSDRLAFYSLGHLPSSP